MKVKRYNGYWMDLFYQSEEKEKVIPLIAIVMYNTVPYLKTHTKVQGDQLYMAVFFWYLVKSDLSSVRVYISLHWKSHFLQVTRKKRPCLTGNPVQVTFGIVLSFTFFCRITWAKYWKRKLATSCKYCLLLFFY